MRRLVLLVSAIVFVDTMFYAVVAPLLPTYADDLDLSRASAGVLAAAYPAGTFIGALPAGVLAARLGAKVTVVAGLVLLGASSLVFGFGQDVVVLDAARFAQGLGGACSWAGGLAWLVEASSRGERGALIGTALGAAIGGQLLGPVVGAVAEATAPEIVFGSAALVAAALSVWAILTPGTARHEAQPLREVTRAMASVPVATAMWLVVLPALGFGVVQVLGPLRLDEFGASATLIGGTFLVAAAVEATISPFVGRVSDRRGRLVPIRAGLLGASAVVVFIVVPQAPVFLAVSIVAVSAAMGAFWAPAMAMLSDAAEDARVQQGFAFALVNLAWATGQVVGNGAGGGLAEATADVVPLLVVSLLCFATFVALTRRRPPVPQG